MGAKNTKSTKKNRKRRKANAKTETSLLDTASQPNPTSFGFFQLPTELIFQVMKYLKTTQVLRIKCVCKAWKEKSDNEEYWEYICQKKGYWFDYETKPTNWLEYFFLVCPKAPKGEWPFSKAENPRVISEVLLHSKSGIPVQISQLKSSNYSDFQNTYHIQRVFGCFKSDKLWLAQPVHEGVTLDKISDKEISKLKINDEFIATICFAISNSNYRFGPSLPSNLRSVILTRNGPPCFQLGIAFKPEYETDSNSVSPDYSYNDSTGSSMYTGTEECLEPDPSPILLFIFALHKLDYKRWEASTKQIPNYKAMKVFLEHCQAVFPKNSKAFHQFLYRMFKASLLTPILPVQDEYLETYADRSFKSIKQIVDHVGFAKIELGPTSGTVRLIPIQLRDRDWVDVENTDVQREFGFTFIEKFFEDYELKELLKHIESAPWLNDRESKRVQIYGYNYLNPTLESKPLPDYFKPLMKKIQENGFGTYDQLIVSEFSPGIGVSPHVDRFFWDESIIGISLLSPCVLELKKIGISLEEKLSTVLIPGSLYCLRGESRYHYTHSIPPYTVESRRISLTFRNLAKEKVILPKETLNLIKL